MKIKGILLSFVFLFCIFCQLATAKETETILDKLNYADTIKSSKNQEFVNLIEQLKPKFDTFPEKETYLYLYLKAYLESYRGNIPSATNTYTHIFEHSSDPVLRYRSAVSLVNLYALEKNWKTIFTYTNYISTHFSTVENQKFRHQGYIALAFLHNELGQYSTTLDYLNQLEQDGLNGRNQCVASGLKIKADLETQASLKLKDNAENAIQYCENLNEHMIAYVLKTYLATSFIKNKQPSKAISILSSSLKQIIDTKYTLLILEVKGLLAEAYHQTEDNVLAKNYALELITQESNVAYLKIIANAYKTLAEIENDLKNHKAAFTYEREYNQRISEHYKNTQENQLAFQTAKQNATQKNNQIKLLNEQNKNLLLEKALIEESAKTNLWIIVLFGFALTMLLAWVYYIKKNQKRLKHLAEFDDLTQVHNRTYFTQSVESLLNIADKQKIPISIILFDLDHFKSINDSYGHLAGDIVLQKVADACTTCVRKDDILARIGGEEFAIVLPDCSVESAKIIAEQCRTKIAKIKIKGINKEISASFGVANSNISGYQLNSLIAHSDEAMYRAKNKGRNQTSIFG